MAEISSDVIRGYNDIIILYLLLNDPSYGYEISKQIRTLSEDKYIIKVMYSGYYSRKMMKALAKTYNETIIGMLKSEA